MIEGALLAFVAKTIDASVIGKLEANLARLQRVVDESQDGKVDAARFNKLAQEFRATLEEAVANPILIRAVKSLDLLSAATRDRLSKAGSLQQLLENHRRMLEALIGHDASAAQSALEAHIDYLADLCDVSLRGGAHV